MRRETKFDAEMAQTVGRLAELLPLEVASKLLINLRDGRGRFFRGKKRSGFLWAHHVDDDEVLPADEREGFIKMPGGERVTEIDEHDKKRPSRETPPQGNHELLVVGGHRLRL